MYSWQIKQDSKTMSKINILILEDNAYDAKLMEHAVGTGISQFETLVVANRNDYVKALKSFRPDVILADFALPAMNGFDALRLAKALPEPLAFIIVTGSIGESKAVKLVKSGAHEVILKDDLKSLPKAIVRALKEVELQQAHQQAVRSLEDNNAYLNKIHNLSPYIIYIFDLANKKPVFISENIASLTGFTNEEIIAKGDQAHMALLHPDSVDSYLESIEAYKKMKDGQQLVFEGKLLSKSGEIVYYRTRSSVFTRSEDGKVEKIIATLEDITASHLSNQKLSESEAHHRALVENSSDITAILNLKGKITYVSPNIERVLGIKAEEVLNKSFFDLLPGESVEAAASRINEITSNPDELYTSEFSIKLPGKAPIYLESVVRVETEGANPSHLIANTREVTGRKNIEKALHEIATVVPSGSGKSFFDLMAKSLADALNINCCIIGLLEKHKNGQVKTIAAYANNEILNNFSYLLEGTPCRDAINNDIATVAKNVLTAYPEDDMLSDMGAECYIGKALKSSEGEALGIMALIDTKPLQNTSIAYDMLSIYSQRVVSELERLASEGNLIKSKEFVNDILGSLDYQIAVINKDGEIIMTNDCWQRFAHENEGSVLLSAKTCMNYLEVCERSSKAGETEAGEAAEGIRKVLNGEQETFSMEYPCHSPGKERWFDMRVTSLKKGEGAVIAHVETTERKLAELKMQKLTGELINSNAELEKFAYVTSHDLRAPAINLVSLLGILDKDRVPDDENKVIIDKIEFVAHTLQETLNNLIEQVAQKKNAKQTNSVIRFDEIVQEVCQAIENRVNYSKAKIKCDFEAVPSIRYVKQHMFSFIQNVLTNSIKYKHPERDPEVTLKTYKSNGYICLAVEDNGIGIDLKTHGEKVFSMFNRFHNGPEGKGLGLYLVKSQLESLGGNITIDSHPGIGTTLKLFLKNNPENPTNIN